MFNHGPGKRARNDNHQGRHYKQHKIDIDAYDERGLTKLFKAAIEGNIEQVKKLLECGAQVDKFQGGDSKANVFKGMTALFGSIHKGHIDVAKLLLDFGAKIDQAQGPGHGLLSEQGVTALFRASIIGPVDIVKLLVQRGADIEKTQEKGPYKGQSALFAASCKGHLDIVRFLISSGAELENKQQTGDHYNDKTALYGAASKHQYEVVRVLILAGANIFSMDKKAKKSSLIGSLRFSYRFPSSEGSMFLDKLFNYREVAKKLTAKKTEQSKAYNDCQQQVKKIKSDHENTLNVQGVWRKLFMLDDVFWTSLFLPDEMKKIADTDLSTGSLLLTKARSKSSFWQGVVLGKHLKVPCVCKMIADKYLAEEKYIGDGHRMLRHMGISVGRRRVSNSTKTRI